MRSKKRHEGYMLIDHRASPGLQPGQGRIPGLPEPLVVPGGKFVEMAIVMCNHCQMEIMLNPKRTRARGYCPGCDHYICDRCDGVRAAGQSCVPIKKIFDDIMEEDARNLNIGEI